MKKYFFSVFINSFYSASTPRVRYTNVLKVIQELQVLWIYRGIHELLKLHDDIDIV